MGKIMVVLSENLENRLRTHIRKRGDLSRIIEEALVVYLNELEKEEEK